jgi:hypothetical protein
LPEKVTVATGFFRKVLPVAGRPSPIRVGSRICATRAAPVVGCAPVPAQEVRDLKAIFVGLCVLFVLVQAAAAAKPSHRVASAQVGAHGKPASVTVRLRRELVVERKARSTIGFFQRHRRLLRSGTHRVVAVKTLVRARQQLRRAESAIRRLRHVLRARDLRKLRTAPPRAAICGAFREHCRDAVAVAWCESRLDTTAENGQYLGLFQMGTMARQRFGHGPSAWEQAAAAHRYFVYAGSTWSPWSCKPSRGYS